MRSHGPLELAAEAAEVLAHEQVEIAQYLIDRTAYQVLTVWGDQIATYTVRRGRRKRRHELLLRVEEFALMVKPEQVVETFEWAHSELSSIATCLGTGQSYEIHRSVGASGCSGTWNRDIR